MSDTGTGTVSNVGTGSGETAPEEVEQEQQAAEEEALELELEAGNKVKIPYSKIPIDKLDVDKHPQLQKLRADLHRQLSEADLKAKQLKPIEQALERVRDNPDELWELAKALGIPHDKLYQLSEKQVAQRIQAQLREEEEKAQPELKEEREAREDRERLKKENERLKAEGEKAYNAQVKSAIIGNLMVPAMDLIQDAGLREDAAHEMVAIMRQAHKEDYDLHPDELALLALKALDARGQRLRGKEFTDDELERAAKVLEERKPKEKSAQAQHPANTQSFGTSKGVKQKSNGVNDRPPATKLLLSFLNGRRP